MATRKRDNTTACQRCGYDLTGAIAAFGPESCPLEGTCSECGYAFSWGDVMNAERRRHPWLFEHASPRAGALVRSHIVTTLRAIWPWWFWRSIALHHRVRPWRLLAWAGWLLVGLWGLAALESLVASAGYRGHWIKIAFTRYLTGSTPPIAASAAYGDSVVISIATMFRDKSGMTWLKVYDALWLQLDTPPAWMWYLPTVLLAWPTLVLALPMTRARCKIRMGHVLRATVYSLVVFLPFLLTAIIEFLLRDITVIFGSRAEIESLMLGARWLYARPGIALFSLLAAVWVCLWWYRVIVGHWRVPHGRSVFLLLLIPTVLSLVISLVMYYLTYPFVYWNGLFPWGSF